MASRFALLSLSILTAALTTAFAAAPKSPGYSLDAARSSIKFSFTQAKAENQGRFKKFSATLKFSDATLAASRLEVNIDTASSDTGDEERDKTLHGADLFSSAKFPQAHYLATKFARVSAGRYEALGNLTLRDVTREVRVPFSFRTSTEQGKNVAYMTGRVAIKRLDFGVGQGDWRSTDQVGDEVTITFNLRLPQAG